MLSGFNRLERLEDFGLELGESAGDVGEAGTGDRGRLAAAFCMMLSNRGRLAGALDKDIGVADVASPAVEDTVETMEGGGEGVIDLAAKLEEPEAGGEDADVWRLGGGTSAILTGRDRVEFTDSGSGDLSMMCPLASIVSRFGLLATTTVLHTASSRKNSLILAHMGLRLDSVPSSSCWMSRLLRCSASLGLTGITERPEDL